MRALELEALCAGEQALGAVLLNPIALVASPQRRISDYVHTGTL